MRGGADVAPPRERGDRLQLLLHADVALVYDVDLCYHGSVRLELLVPPALECAEAPAEGRDRDRRQPARLFGDAPGQRPGRGMDRLLRLRGWRRRTRTSESSIARPPDYDLSSDDLLHPLFELIPQNERTGAIVGPRVNICGSPSQVRSQIARTTVASSPNQSVSSSSSSQTSNSVCRGPNE